MHVYSPVIRLTENKCGINKMSKAKSGFYEKINKIDRSPASRERGERERKRKRKERQRHTQKIIKKYKEYNSNIFTLITLE